MTIPFLDLFNKLRDRFHAAPPQSTAETPAPPHPVRQTTGDRRSKTVLPRPLPPRNTTIPTRPSFAPLSRARELPPALAKALEPKLERAISLRLLDFLDQIPAEYVKPVEVIEPNRPVTLKASEIEKGMAEQRPSISLPSLYQQVPEIFLRSVAATDLTRVSLPYDKVLEQFTMVQVRSDQQRDERVPQLETPILQATIEDTKRFGTKIEPVESSILPAMPVNPATAENFASAEPEAAEIVTSPKVSASAQAISLNNPATEPAKVPFKIAFETAPPLSPSLKIPFQFPPNGTGAPASERVPASCGPPVPPLSTPPPKLESNLDSSAIKAEPTPAPVEQVTDKSKSIAFKFGGGQTSPPLKMASAATAAKSTPEAPTREIADKDDDEPSLVPTPREAATITLSLRPVMENIPAFQREDDLSAIPDGTKLTFPLDLVQTQLASGRVLVPAKTFERALPPSQRSLFVVDREETPVSLPLDEVLKNLPSGALKMREDQQKFFPEEEFVTPISLKAKEDAVRLKPVTAAISKPEATTAEAKKEAKAEVVPDKNEIDGKQVLSAACELPGVAACELMFPDGLSLAGNLPAELRVDGLCAMAPTLLQRVDTHMHETKLGPLGAVTLHARDSAITFLMTENIYLAALHKDAAALPAETRTQLSDLVGKLSRTFARPETSHVDH